MTGFLGEGIERKRRCSIALLRTLPQLCAYWSTAFEPFVGTEKHDECASKGTWVGPDIVELTPQAGEGRAIILLNCPPLALSLFSSPAPLSFSGVGFSLG